MMTITTQDGRTLQINTENKIECYAAVLFHDKTADAIDNTYSYIQLREVVKDNNGKTIDVSLHERIGNFKNERAHKVAAAFHAALNAGADEFIIPQQSDAEYEVISAYAAMEKFINSGRFTQATPEETAIGLKGYERAKAIRLAKETDYWERRNVLIYHDDADIFASFKKWQALQIENERTTA